MSHHQCDGAWRFIQPELMTQEQLLMALQERNIRVDEITAKDKRQLVDLCKRVAMPLPQRSCFRKKMNSPVKMDIDPPQNQIRQNSYGDRQVSNASPATMSRVPGTSSGAQSSMAKIRLKRTITELAETTTSQNGPAPKKREKITWP